MLVRDWNAWHFLAHASQRAGVKVVLVRQRFHHNTLRRAMEHGDDERHCVTIFKSVEDLVQPEEFLHTVLFFCELIEANKGHIAYMRTAATQHKFGRTDTDHVFAELTRQKHNEGCAAKNGAAGAHPAGRR